jgi:hypothetical protein
MGRVEGNAMTPNLLYLLFVSSMCMLLWAIIWPLT